ncbi:hypothetical protein EVU96_24845 [Bacillus infantis]|uniref:hypothetical protein n=1 Tax=Bacillus infantis TaxID=324767 RepID=UPI00101C5DA4|nr:hypothetical protein [Bacillus infantis]RYI25196.1 hypothetical protein EVU96_24845 [Bacillus infantis]
MDKPFQFADFIDEFKKPYTLINRSEGYFADNGDWIEGQEDKVPREGIFLPLSEDDLQYSEGGSYSIKDKKVYDVLPLDQGDIIEYKGEQFTVQNFKDYTDYADVYIYYARWREK